MGIGSERTSDEPQDISPAFIAERALSFARKPAIVYDTFEDKLYQLPQNKVEGFPVANMPGRSIKADIYLKVDDGEESGTQIEASQKPEAWLAKVDLSRLSWTARWKRMRGDLKEIYIKRDVHRTGI